jgi:hypothetical protein
MTTTTMTADYLRTWGYMCAAVCLRGGVYVDTSHLQVSPTEAPPIPTYRSYGRSSPPDDAGTDKRALRAMCSPSIPSSGSFHVLGLTSWFPRWPTAEKAMAVPAQGGEGRKKFVNPMFGEPD